MVAAIVCLISLTALSFLPFLLVNSSIKSERIRNVVGYLNFFPLGPHAGLGDFNRGLVTVGHLAYPLTGILLCLFLTVRILESRSWK